MINYINWVDIFFIILLLGMGYKGLKYGAVYQFLSVIGTFFLIFVSIGFYNFFSEAVFSFLSLRWARPISFCLIIISGCVAIKTIKKVFELISTTSSGRKKKLSPGSKVGGVLIVLGRACLLYGLIGIFLLLIPNNFTRTSVKAGSKTCMVFIGLDVELYSWITGAVNITAVRETDEIIEGFTSEE